MGTRKKRGRTPGKPGYASGYRREKSREKVKWKTALWAGGRGGDGKSIGC